jgi:membrane protease YdiL (CAAX protease family)
MIQNYQYKPLVYFVATFTTTYLFWFAGAYQSFQDGNDGMHMILMLPGLLAPFIISLVMIYVAKNENLKRDFVDRLINLKLIQIRYLPVFLFLMPAAVLVSILISLLFGGSTSQFQFSEEFSFSGGFVPVLLVLLLAATFEELGWRGYAFDSLLSRFNYFQASIIFSTLWSLWHFPLLFVKGSYQYEIGNEDILFAVNFFVSVIPMGMIISWVCMKNGKSILAAVFFHFVINMSQETLEMTQVTKCIETVVLTLVAAAIIYRDREMFFSKKHLASDHSSAR